MKDARGMVAAGILLFVIPEISIHFKQDAMQSRWNSDAGITFSSPKSLYTQEQNLPSEGHKAL